MTTANTCKRVRWRHQSEPTANPIRSRSISGTAPPQALQATAA